MPTPATGKPILQVIAEQAKKAREKTGTLTAPQVNALVKKAVQAKVEHFVTKDAAATLVAMKHKGGRRTKRRRRTRRTRRKRRKTRRKRRKRRRRTRRKR